jgi:preprotein translocase subunit YajC
MATPSPSFDDTLRRLLDQQVQLLAKVSELKPQQQNKDGWDKLGALSGLLIALVGGMFSFLYSYHQSQQDSTTQAHQQKLQEVQTVGTFMQYLVGNDDAAKSVALDEVRSILSSQAAIQIVEELDAAKKAAGSTTPDPVAVRFLQHVIDNGKSDAERQLATAALQRVRSGAPSR